eukprot:3400706-Pleurochrysis_carterae.AAC.2
MPEWAQVDSSCVNSPTSRAANPCPGPSREARASNRLTSLESTAFDRSWESWQCGCRPPWPPLRTPALGAHSQLARESGEPCPGLRLVELSP